MGIENPNFEKDDEITRREFLTGKWGKKKPEEEKSADITADETTEKKDEEKKITRREFLTGKWPK